MTAMELATFGLGLMAGIIATLWALGLPDRTDADRDDRDKDHEP